MNKTNKKGFLLPPAVGYSFKVLFFLLGRHRISVKYLPRLILTLIVNLINFPFRWYEKVFIDKKFKAVEIKNDPVFIIGHWRSGTTHLHNILCQDPQMAYTSTYQSVFPDTLFNKAGRFLFEGFARLLIPGTRKGDNVTLGMELPQEEEFALGAKTPLSFYYFWMFPKKIKQFYQRCVRFENAEKDLQESWKQDYELLIKKAIKNTGRKRFLSKNPPNTGRVEQLLRIFPNARFIHIHRNPIEVYLSTYNFFHKMLPHLQLQKIEDKDLDHHIFELYKIMMHDYSVQKKMIPVGQLTEISFDELERDPLSCIRKVYLEVNLPGYEAAKAPITKYIEKMKSYKKNRHVMTHGLISKIAAEWGFAMEQWQYKVPDHIEISNDA